MLKKIPMSGVILAGGKSSRMGQDKAFLRFGKGTMLESLARLMNSIFEETLIIVNEKMNCETLDLCNAVVYVDIFKNHGPLAGLYTALAYSKCAASCVMPCDMPFVDEALLRDLADSAEEEYDALCFEDAEGRLQPFPGLYFRSVRHLIWLLLDRGEFSMQRFLQVAVIKPLVLEKEKSRVWVNMNTPEDYHQVLKEKKGLGRE